MVVCTTRSDGFVHLQWSYCESGKAPLQRETTDHDDLNLRAPSHAFARRALAALHWTVNLLLGIRRDDIGEASRDLSDGCEAIGAQSGLVSSDNLAAGCQAMNACEEMRGQPMRTPFI